jgi:hypothetical protein
MNDQEYLMVLHYEKEKFNFFVTDGFENFWKEDFDKAAIMELKDALEFDIPIK